MSQRVCVTKNLNVKVDGKGSGNMIYTCTYPSPLGNILLAADELTGFIERQNFCKYTSKRNHFTGDTRSDPGEKMAGCIFFRERAGFYSCTSSCRFPVSPGCMADLTADPLWTDYDIWRDCKKDGTDAGCASYVCTGCRRSSRT